MNKSSHWPAGLAVFYISFMIITIAVVVFSTFHRVDLVAEDYYDQEIRYQEQIERVRRADSLSLPVTWEYNRDRKSLLVHFPPELKAEKITGRFHFFRPSDASLDKFFTLNLAADNSQILYTGPLQPGLWKLKILWAINNKEFFVEGILVI